MEKNRTHFSTSFDMGVPVVHITGDLDYASSKRCRSILGELAEQGHLKAIADLRELDYMDSSGMSAIMFSAKQFSQMGGHLVIVTDNPSLTRKFEIGGLTAFPSIIRKFESMEEALADLKKE